MTLQPNPRTSSSEMEAFAEAGIVPIATHLDCLFNRPAQSLRNASTAITAFLAPSNQPPPVVQLGAADLLTLATLAEWLEAVADMTEAGFRAGASTHLSLQNLLVYMPCLFFAHAEGDGAPPVQGP